MKKNNDPFKYCDLTFTPANKFSENEIMDIAETRLQNNYLKPPEWDHKAFYETAKKCNNQTFDSYYLKGAEVIPTREGIALLLPKQE